MNAQEATAFKKQIRSHIRIFLVVLVGMLISVGLCLTPIGIQAKIAVALSIAVIQAALVASFLMHLNAERKSVYAVLGLTVFFFMGLGVLTIWASHDSPEMTRHLQVPSHSAPAHHVP